MPSKRWVRRPVSRSSRLRGVWWVLLTISLIALGTFLPWSTDHAAVASSPSASGDSDGDGLADAIETYLSTASSAAALAADPTKADTDGDGQLDGFEYCLSGGADVVSPGVVHVMEPKITVGSYQEGDCLVLSLYVIPGDIAAVDEFYFLVTVPTPWGVPAVLDLTTVLGQNLTFSGTANQGPYQMSVYSTTIPVSVVGAFPSFSVAALGKIAGVKTGDSATFTVHQGRAFRWRFSALSEPNSNVTAVESMAEPQSLDAPLSAQPEKVCQSVDVTEATSVPGVVTRVPIAGGCNGGSWTCAEDVCSSSLHPKQVFDHLSLLQ